MKRLLAILFLMSVASVVFAVPPVTGDLCVGIEAPSETDFWQKWDAADLVVYGAALFDVALGMPSSAEQPETAVGSVLVMVAEVWKGPESLSAVEMWTSWDYHVWDCNPPELGRCIYTAEPCALRLEAFQNTVLFLRYSEDSLWSYMCYGSDVYDLQWLEEYVGAPVPADEVSWDSVKALYR